jgi:hypothetical protein
MKSWVFWQFVQRSADLGESVIPDGNGDVAPAA